MDMEGTVLDDETGNPVADALAAARNAVEDIRQIVRYRGAYRGAERGHIRADGDLIHDGLVRRVLESVLLDLCHRVQDGFGYERGGENGDEDGQNHRRRSRSAAFLFAFILLRAVCARGFTESIIGFGRSVSFHTFSFRDFAGCKAVFDRVNRADAHELTVGHELPYGMNCPSGIKERFALFI